MQELPTLRLVGFVLTWRVLNAGTAYPSLGGVHINMAGVLEDAGTAYPSLGGVHVNMAGVLEDAGTAYPSLGGVRVNIAGVRCRNCLPFAWWGSC